MSSIPVLPEPTNANAELVLVSVSVEAHQLEDLLEALADAPFPINPQIIHRSPLTKVEFPAYSSQLDTVRSLLEAKSFAANEIAVTNMLEAMGCRD